MSHRMLVPFGLLLVACLGQVSARAEDGAGDEGQDFSHGVTDTDEDVGAGDADAVDDSDEPADEDDGYVHPPPQPCPIDDSNLWVWENVERASFHEPSNMQAV